MGEENKYLDEEFYELGILYEKIDPEKDLRDGINRDWYQINDLHYPDEKRWYQYRILMIAENEEDKEAAWLIHLKILRTAYNIGVEFAGGGYAMETEKEEDQEISEGLNINKGVRNYFKRDVLPYIRMATDKFKDITPLRDQLGINPPIIPLHHFYSDREEIRKLKQLKLDKPDKISEEVIDRVLKIAEKNRERENSLKVKWPQDY